jgi:hypothetical protein
LLSAATVGCVVAVRTEKSYDPGGCLQAPDPQMQQILPWRAEGQAGYGAAP